MYISYTLQPPSPPKFSINTPLKLDVNYAVEELYMTYFYESYHKII